MKDKHYSVLQAFLHITDNPQASILPTALTGNRINDVGDALEGFIKDSIVGLLNNQSVNDVERSKLYSEAFSWLGNKANPPDCMIKGGDAIEIKKIQSLTSEIALNSSHPKNKLFVDDTRVAASAKIAESWDVKDIVYAIGSTVDSLELKRLWFIYGDCYCASRHVYESITQTITNGVNSIPEIDFVKTNEIGRVNKIDPLGITKMRLRGMWHISNPSVLYKDLVKTSGKKQFYLLMREAKYRTSSDDERRQVEQVQKPGFSNNIIDIRDPDNPAKLIKARFLKYEI